MAVSSPQMGPLKLIIAAHKVDNLSMKINIEIIIKWMAISSELPAKNH